MRQGRQKGVRGKGELKGRLGGDREATGGGQLGSTQRSTHREQLVHRYARKIVAQAQVAGGVDGDGAAGLSQHAAAGADGDARRQRVAAVGHGDAAGQGCRQGTGIGSSMSGGKGFTHEQDALFLRIRLKASPAPTPRPVKFTRRGSPLVRL